MIIDTTLFFASFGGVIVLVTARLVEVNKERSLIVTRFWSKCDEIVVPHAFHIKKIFSHFNKDSLKLVFVLGLKHFHRGVTFSGEKVREYYVRLSGATRARRLLGNKSVVSSFLKDVGEYKDKLTGGEGDK